MKKVISTLVALSTVASVGVLSNVALAKTSSKTIVLGMSFPAADHGWMAAVDQNAQQEGQSKGFKVFMTTASDPNKQTSDVENLITKKVSVIVMDPIDTNALTPVVGEAKKAGIPVVLFDRGIANSNYTEIVTGDNKAIGVQAGKYISTQLKGKGNVVIISGVPGDVTNARTQGFQNAIKGTSLKVVANQTGKFTEQDAYTAMQNILQAHPHIDAVYSEDDEMSLGVLKAIKEAHRSDIKIVTGTGGDKNFYSAIKNNTYPGIKLVTFTYSPLMVKQAVDEAISIAEGKKPAKKNNVIEPTQVDKSNVAKYYVPTANY